jgi:hypothetical protein
VCVTIAGVLAAAPRGATGGAPTAGRHRSDTPAQTIGGPATSPRRSHSAIACLPRRPGGEATPIGRPEERIGSIRVRPDGTVAWIACPLGPDADPDKIISRKPECVRPRRARNRVLLFRPAQGFRDERIRQLSAASRIDPASLRMNATTVSWTRSGRRVRYRYR